jgi:hypothetical protein
MGWPAPGHRACGFDGSPGRKVSVDAADCRLRSGSREGTDVMRSLRLFAAGFAVLAMLSVSSAAWSDGGRRGHHHHSHGSSVRFGFVFGGPLWYPGSLYSYPYSYPYPYAYPPTVIVPSEPRVYIERDDRVAQQNSPGYWYYCRESNTYYPYVKECAEPWERVPAQPRNP